MGDLIVYDDGGVLDLLNPTLNTETMIASGDSRGDYVGFYPSNGTLFPSQGDSVLRLTFAGGTIGGGNQAPELASCTVIALGLCLAGMVTRRRGDRFQIFALLRKRRRAQARQKSAGSARRRPQCGVRVCVPGCATVS